MNLPPLPARPYPHRAQFLFTDGRVRVVDSYCGAVMMGANEHRNIARKVPCGLPIRTDAQKLFLLGRKAFASAETVDALRVKPENR